MARTILKSRMRFKTRCRVQSAAKAPFRKHWTQQQKSSLPCSQRNQKIRFSTRVVGAKTHSMCLQPYIPQYRLVRIMLHDSQKNLQRVVRNISASLDMDDSAAQRRQLSFRSADAYLHDDHDGISHCGEYSDELL